MSRADTVAAETAPRSSARFLLEAGRHGEEVSMSAVVRSWIRAFCRTCGKKQVFELQDGWVATCGECG
jgi:hypothetical protein